jgi:hypothetical protein
MSERLQRVEALREQIQTLLTEEYRDLVRACFKEHPEFVEFVDFWNKKYFLNSEGEEISLFQLLGEPIKALQDFLEENEDLKPWLGSDNLLP